MGEDHDSYVALRFLRTRHLTSNAVTIAYLLFTIILTGVYQLLPQHLHGLEQRMLYYFFGGEAEKGVYVPRFVAGLVGHNSSREL